MNIQTAIDTIKINPERLILIDGIGAFCSTLMLAVVLVQYETVFGIPQNALYFLSLFPIIFCIYDFICFAFVKNNIATLLKIIASANTLYCALSIGTIYLHSHSVTNWGWSYIILEVIIVLSLAQLEFKTAFFISRKDD